MKTTFAYRVKAGRPPRPPVTPTLQLKGQRFGHLTVLDFIQCRDGKSWWSCLCDCKGPGSQVIVRSDKLTCGQTRACKCRMGYKKPGMAIGTKMPRLTTPAPPVRPKPPKTEAAPPSPEAPAKSPYCKDFSEEALSHAELLSARQMRKGDCPCPWSDVAAYLAINRPDGCTIAQAQQLLAPAA
jgi:hypothetical protein